MFKQLASTVFSADFEKEVLAFWQKNDIFKKSLEARKNCTKYIFYDGPPFATGLPHYGHLLAGTIKDIIPRYQTMRGKFVPRRFGWDCHGLPVEYEMEQELSLHGKQDIIKYGIDRFNEQCRSIVLRYVNEWRSTVSRMGRWVDFDHDYKTMDPAFMESIFWVFKSLWEKKLVYEGMKILPYCPRCATPLSNFETNQGYKETDDPSVTVRFRSAASPDTWFLAWTTTPWTLPSNFALAVGKGIKYVKIRDNNNFYIMAKERLPVYYKNSAEYQIIRELSDEELCGQKYLPLFPYFSGYAEKNSFRILTGDFVSTEDGTGIVHLAPAFGEDDYALALKEKIAFAAPVDDEGKFTSEIPDYQGRFVKDCDKDIIERLKKEGSLIHRSRVRHNYPFCWRCDTPLLYRGISTWFVNVESIKKDMLDANSNTSWVPQ
ncbi:MAG TPA: isoleucine--tRNA ligase, partial [Spirochaetia bacterium]|nr:isoleucine--tRNA ligase [Spirochaetia bacterium]